MFAYAVVGAPRQGKSLFAKNMILIPDRRAGNGEIIPGTLRAPAYVYDVRNEYGDSYRTNINGKDVWVPGPALPANRPELARSRYAGVKMSPKYFLEVVGAKSCTNVIFEEATTYLKGNTSEDLRDIINGRFHSGNNLIFVFHSLRTIPPDIMSMLNWVVLFNTNDNEQLVRSKYGIDELTEGFIKQRLQRNRITEPGQNYTKIRLL